MEYTKPVQVCFSKEVWDLIGDHLVSTEGNYSPSDYVVSLLLNGILDEEGVMGFDVVKGKVVKVC